MVVTIALRRNCMKPISWITILDIFYAVTTSDIQWNYWEYTEKWYYSTGSVDTVLSFNFKVSNQIRTQLYTISSTNVAKTKLETFILNQTHAMSVVTEVYAEIISYLENWSKRFFSDTEKMIFALFRKFVSYEKFLSFGTFYLHVTGEPSSFSKGNNNESLILIVQWKIAQKQIWILGKLLCASCQ